MSAAWCSTSPGSVSVVSYAMAWLLGQMVLTSYRDTSSSTVPSPKEKRRRWGGSKQGNEADNAFWRESHGLNFSMQATIACLSCEGELKKDSVLEQAESGWVKNWSLLPRAIASN